MLYQWLRLFRSDNGTLTDISLENQDETATNVQDIVASEDYLYLGQQFPFNNFYYKSEVANTNASTMALEYWDGSNWILAVDLLDGTRSTTKTLAKSGLVQFSPNLHNRWQITYDTSEIGVGPTALNSITVYNMYWLRIKFSADLAITTESKKFCYCFSSHQQVAQKDSTLANYLTAFGVTTWEDYIINASIEVVNDLKRMSLIINRGQILKIEDVSVATDWKTMMGLYFELGGDYQEKYTNAIKRYADAIDLKSYTFDINKNAMIEPIEMDYCQSRVLRT